MNVHIHTTNNSLCLRVLCERQLLQVYSFFTTLALHFCKNMDLIPLLFHEGHRWHKKPEFY